jgi:hypothetical protein
LKKFNYAVIIFFIIYAATVLAQVPRTISYQGVLTDTLGHSKPDGNYSFTFRLYSSENNGTALWSETKTLPVNHGLFTTFLGNVTPINLKFDAPYWLSIQVSGGTELTPRIQLASVGYSFHTINADTAAFTKFTDSSRVTGSITNNSVSTVKIANNAVTTDKIAESAVTGSKISNGQVVKALNGLTDNVTLGTTGGATITKNGNTITINAGSGGSGFTLPFNGSGTSNDPLFFITNSGIGKVGSFVTDNSTSSSNALEGISKGSGNGVYGESPTIGVFGFGKNADGVVGTSDNGYGVEGLGSISGVYGKGLTVGVEGYASATSGETRGVEGIANSSTGVGVLGSNLKSGGTGILGKNTGGLGVTGFGVTGVYGNGTGTSSSVGVLGIANGSNSIAIDGSGENYGLSSAGNNIGIYAHNGSGTPGRDVYLSTSSLAADMYGNVYIHGNITKSGGSFKIDDPIDPANKYLYHSFVESPDMKNIYDGVVILDSQGEATIQLPAWFEALNRDFRYQITAIGAPGPNLYIASEINNNEFRIAGGTSGMKVSWMVTGIRHDAWANAHRIPIEVDKQPEERGFYEHPELFGQPADKSIQNSLHPEITRMETEGKIMQEKLKTIGSGINSKIPNSNSK